MNKKYELTDETIIVDKCIIYRIRALRDFKNAKAGDLGGYIRCENNLNQDGDCWVTEDATVSGNALIYENALISETAWISGDAHVCGDVFICEKAKVCGCAHAYGRARIFGKVELDSGIWNNTIKINNNMYLISTTLQKILMVEHVYE